jgi:hypothetical protein
MVAGEGNNYDLPNTVREVAEVLGRRRALELVGMLVPATDVDSPSIGKRGISACLYVPKTLDGVHGTSKLVELLGREDAQKLVDEFAGIALFLRPCNGLVRRGRDAAIRQMVAEGWSTHAVALAFDVCQRTVRNLTRGEQ